MHKLATDAVTTLRSVEYSSRMEEFEIHVSRKRFKNSSHRERLESLKSIAIEEAKRDLSSDLDSVIVAFDTTASIARLSWDEVVRALANGHSQTGVKVSRKSRR